MPQGGWSLVVGPLIGFLLSPLLSWWSASRGSRSFPTSCFLLHRPPPSSSSVLLLPLPFHCGLVRGLPAFLLGRRPARSSCFALLVLPVVPHCGHLVRRVVVIRDPHFQLYSGGWSRRGARWLRRAGRGRPPGADEEENDGDAEEEARGTRNTKKKQEEATRSTRRTRRQQKHHAGEGEEDAEG